MKARKEEKSSLCGVLMVLVAIAVGVAGIVYALSTHRRHVNQEKWKDYDECGLVKENIGSFSSINAGLFQSIFPWKCKTKILFW